MSRWSAADIPDQTGRTVLVTGATSGLGLRTAAVLARRGATVLMTCRDPKRGRQAWERLLDDSDGVGATLVLLDLADLASVRKAADRVRELTGDRLDVLVNNAGVMATPARLTVDGFELQIATNHLGHAALTWLLAPALTPGARVITVSSLAHRGGGLDVEDLNFDRRRYNPATAYSASKLANLLFTFELDRRARAAGRNLLAVAAHPGLADTELTVNTARMYAAGRFAHVVRWGTKLVAQRAAMGALPQLYAATAADVRSGEYFGPTSLGETRGTPGRATASPAARDEHTAQLLWERTAELTGVTPDPA
ncbi:MAG: SDR family NAD(P)-dependent oxidoreductase [Pseudonocardiales bacterium]|nr:SDR family NAD(P)-dependent oxidoreductase [Pseudonocardiales bacterium]MBV9028807.1 SDR family NAD(P)-dependent oxidoreductase [Pseudonocardiales bacterium]MBW0009923.1 SDR family NAD(P)-dependent oxidoreductase [Pseudonocardiales bacterium]